MSIVPLLSAQRGSDPVNAWELGVLSDGGSFVAPSNTDNLYSRLVSLGLMSGASLVNSCNAGKASALYNFVPSPVQSLDRFTVTRASTKLRIGSNGLYGSVANNVPAFEFNTDGSYRGMLVEPGATNLALWSRDFTQASWAKTNITPTLTATGIFGDANSASTLTATAGNGTALQTVTVASAQRIQSFFLRRRTGTGTVEITQDNGTTWTAVTLTSAWQRFSTPSQTIANPVFGVRIVTSGDAIDVDVAMQETGSVATSPIVTAGSTANRVADVVSLTGASSLIGQTEGTLYAEVETRKFTSTGDRRILNIRVDGNNVINLSVASTSGAYNFDAVNGGASQVAITSGVISGTIDRLGAGYKVNDFAFYVNGSLVGTDVSGTVPNVTTGTIGLGVRGDGAASTQFNGWIRSVALFPTRLANATLASLTA